MNKIPKEINMIADNRQGKHILLINFYYALQRVSTEQGCQVFLHSRKTIAHFTTTRKSKPLKNKHYNFSGINYAQILWEVIGSRDKIDHVWKTKKAV